MKRAIAVIVGVLPLLLATAAFADTPSAQAAGTVQAPPVLSEQNGAANSPPPLFMLGQLPVRVWAPVAPPYDAEADRSAAADPLWNIPN